jgi:hypothetical protein
MGFLFFLYRNKYIVYLCVELWYGPSGVVRTTKPERRKVTNAPSKQALSQLPLHTASHLFIWQLYNSYTLHTVTVAFDAAQITSDHKTENPFRFASALVLI